MITNSTMMLCRFYGRILRKKERSGRCESRNELYPTRKSLDYKDRAMPSSSCNCRCANCFNVCALKLSWGKRQLSDWWFLTYFQNNSRERQKLPVTCTYFSVFIHAFYKSKSYRLPELPLRQEFLQLIWMYVASRYWNDNPACDFVLALFFCQSTSCDPYFPNG